jgi:hypothetical protein
MSEEETKYADCGDPQKRPQPSKMMGCHGCIIILISMIMAAAGISLFIISRSTPSEKAIPFKGHGEKLVLIEDIDPENKFGISLKLTVAGNHYYTYTVYSGSGTSKNRRVAVTQKALVHKIPYSIRATRESDGKVVFELSDKFETGSGESIKKQDEILRNSPSLLHDFPKFDFTDKVRFEVILKDDEEYSAKVESGNFSVYKISAARNTVSKIALLVTVLGFLGLLAGSIATLSRGVFAVRSAVEVKDRQ